MNRNYQHSGLETTDAHKGPPSPSAPPRPYYDGQNGHRRIVGTGEGWMRVGGPLWASVYPDIPALLVVPV
ncbi:MAG: hypothetical protein ACYDER_19180 [Ktedonobacteraceae bacterium]